MRLTRWEGRNPDGSPRAVLNQREGLYWDCLQPALRKLAMFEDMEEDAMPSNYIPKGYRTTDEIIQRRREMVTREDKRLQAIAMIDGAVAKRLLAEQLREEAEKDMAEARTILNEIKEAENAAG